MKKPYDDYPWTLETKHHVEGSEKYHEADLQIWSGNEFVAVIPPSYAAKRRGNANLIVAAPEMLEALQNLLSSYEDETSGTFELSLINARNVIKKAKGLE